MAPPLPSPPLAAPRVLPVLSRRQSISRRPARRGSALRVARGNLFETEAVDSELMRAGEVVDAPSGGATARAVDS